MTWKMARSVCSETIELTVEIVGFELLEKLLQQRLEELLVSMKRPDLKGKLKVKIEKIGP